MQLRIELHLTLCTSDNVKLYCFSEVKSRVLICELYIGIFFGVTVTKVTELNPKLGRAHS